VLALKSAVATIVVPGIACVLIPFYIINRAQISLTPPPGILQVLAILIASFGTCMIVWVSTAFVRQGKGTPIPIDPPTRFIITGLYRYVRNPMYVGAVLIVLAEAVYFQYAWLVLYAIGLWAVLHIALVIFEEPQLKKRFGADYEQYLKSVPRWIPKLQTR
jgi:protein-S-isoprenylcysteine O-methyltransferase Ste14